MALVISCDSCGKTLEKRQLVALTRFNEHEQPTTVPDEAEIYDLCEDCLAGLLRTVDEFINKDPEE